MEKYRSIVECKKTDAVSSKQELQAWEEICRVFNAKGLSPEYRPSHKIKVLWDNIKCDTRRKLSTLRQETFKTGKTKLLNIVNKQIVIVNKLLSIGGGRNPVKGDLFCLQVKEIIGSTADPMDNAFDDDALSGTLIFYCIANFNCYHFKIFIYFIEI